VDRIALLTLEREQRALDLEQALAAVRAELQKWNELIVTKTEPVKDQIKSVLTNEERAMIGTENTQLESFWVNPKCEKEIPTPAAQAA